jgi:PAT family beta-lactamase induction signal transducer AmpG
MQNVQRLRSPGFVRLYFNRRALTILFLGFSSGLPIVLIGATLQAWYTKSGVGIMTIGALSLVGQPYTWKFLWAPLFDRFGLSQLGRRRSWILVWQIGIALGLVFIAFHSPKLHPWLVAGLALMTAFFSASQDTVIDAYRTDLLPEEERGVGAAMTSLGYRIAMLVAGSIALIIAQFFGWHVTYIIMALLMLLCMGITLQGPKPKYDHQRPNSFKESVVAPFLDFIKRPYVVTIILFIVTYKLTDALALALNTYFILHFLKFSLIDLGAITKVAGLIGVLTGSILGGALYPRMGLYKALMYFGVLQAVSALLFALLTVVGKNYTLMAVSIFGENFCSGLSSVAFIVYLTAMCNLTYTATQYALFSAIMSLGRVYIGPVASLLVLHFGWFNYYIISFLVGFIPLAILYYLKDRQDEFMKC